LVLPLTNLSLKAVKEIEMKICGIDIKGSEAIIAMAPLDGQALSHVALATKKIALDDLDEAANVRVFAAQVVVGT
jgi:hypothetical protein